MSSRLARSNKGALAFRNMFVARTVTAGCFNCSGSDALWHGPNAQGVAARHHDATGHTTWADIGLSVRYGEEREDKG